MIEARTVDPFTGKPANYGVARFDFAVRSAISSNGDILASEIEAAVYDWVKISVESPQQGWWNLLLYAYVPSEPNGTAPEGTLTLERSRFGFSLPCISDGSL